ncbi:TolC family protein [Oceanispirochaeta sp.]|jgi:outer membrane protein TolC|uniref:TolC family protein n=1 Tax=Oceanispirochaeta sp. TaxID=2035350 RepID=UPI00261525D0|nr:TolC family protein [Oceanispirochaeta sp.]MDA3959013.1 TolC family protein [Oceanispirochaeta sp.]
MKKIFILLTLLISLVLNIHGETINLTADAAVALALENNLSLQSESLSLSIKERTKETAWNAFVPEISAGGGMNYSQLLLSDPDPLYVQNDKTWTVSGSLSANLRLNAGVGTGIKQYQIDYEAGLLSYEDARKKINRDVRNKYFNIITMDANLKLKQMDITLAQKRYEQARENYKNGLISELDMLKAQVTVENTKPEYNSLLTSYRSALMNFKLVLGIPGTVELAMTEGLDMITLYRLDADALIDRYSAKRMDVLQINKSIESLKNKRKLQSQSERTPWLTLSSSWGTRVPDGLNGDNWKQEVWQDSATIGLNLSIPLDGYIPGSSTDVTLENLDKEIQKLVLQRQQIYDFAEIEIRSLVMTLQNSIDTIDTYTLNVDLAKKSFDLTTEAYNLGTRELLDVETAQSELMSASQNVLREKYNYKTKLLDLEYAINSDDISEILEEK